MSTRLDRVDDWVEYELEQLDDLPITGPFRLCGWSFGGVIALELARALIERGDGDRIASVELIDSWIPKRVHRGRLGKMIVRLRKATTHLEAMEPLSVEERRAYVREHGPPMVRTRARYVGRVARRAITRPAGNPASAPPQESLTPEMRSIWVPWLKYEPRPFPRPVVIYTCARERRASQGRRQPRVRSVVAVGVLGARGPRWPPLDMGAPPPRGARRHAHRVVRVVHRPLSFSASARKMKWWNGSTAYQ